jgi:hypothetical protein
MSADLIAAWATVASTAITAGALVFVGFQTKQLVTSEREANKQRAFQYESTINGLLATIYPLFFDASPNVKQAIDADPDGEVYAKLDFLERHHAEVIGQHVLDILDLVARTRHNGLLPISVKMEGTDAYLRGAVTNSFELQRLVRLNSAWYAPVLVEQV